MNIFWHTCRDTLRSLFLPFVGCLLVGVLAIVLLSDEAGEGAGINPYTGAWLHLPALLLVATGLAAALDSWPLFSRERPGHSWLQRIENHPTHGCVAAALGSATALGLGLAAVGSLFVFALVMADAAPQPLSARISFEARSTRNFLAVTQPVLTFDSKRNTAVERLVIRPVLAGLPTAVKLTVYADGKALHQGVLTNLGERIELILAPPRPLEVVELRLQAGSGGALYIPAEGLEGLAPSGIPTWINGLLASLSYLLPAALGFAIMVLGHHRLALPVNFGAGLSVMLVATLTEFTPNSQAISAFARGRWLGTEDLGAPILLTSAVTAGMLASAWLLGRMERSQQPWHKSSPSSSPQP